MDKICFPDFETTASENFEKEIKTLNLGRSVTLWINWCIDYLFCTSL